MKLDDMLKKVRSTINRWDEQPDYTEPEMEEWLRENPSRANSVELLTNPAFEKLPESERYTLADSYVEKAINGDGYMSFREAHESLTFLEKLQKERLSGEIIDPYSRQRAQLIDKLQTYTDQNIDRAVGEAMAHVPVNVTKGKKKATIFGLVTGLLTGGVVYAGGLDTPLEQTFSSGDLDAHLTFTNGDNVLASDFIATVTDSATGHIYSVEKQDGYFSVKNLDTPVKDQTGVKVPTKFLQEHIVNTPTEDYFAVPVSLSERGDLTVTIYDVRGREVQSKKYSNQEAGKHLVQGFAKDLDEGMYIVSTKINGQQQAKKMIVMRGQGNGIMGKRGYQAQQNVDVFQNIETVMHGDPFPPDYFEEQEVSVGKSAGKTYKIRIVNTEDPKRWEDIDQRVRMVSDTTLYFNADEIINFSGQTFTTNEDGTLLIPKNDLATAPYGLASVEVEPGHSVIYVTPQGELVQVTTDKDVNSTDYGLLPLVVRATAQGGTVKEGQVMTEWNAMPDVNLIFEYIEHPENISIEDATSRLIIDGKAYETNNGQLKIQLTPGSRTVSAASDSSLAPYVIEIDGQKLVSYVGKNHSPLVLGTEDVEGIVQLINKHFDDHNIYSRIWDKESGDFPRGGELWHPPADKSDPPGTTTLYSMGIGDDMPVGPNRVNLYIWLGEDADHQLPPEFEFLRSAYNLQQMPDNVKDDIVQFVQTELDSLVNVGKKPGEEYETHIYAGREPPFRIVDHGGGDLEFFAKVGWHVILPTAQNRHKEEVGPDNSIYSAYSRIDVEIYSDSAMKEEVAQTRGPRSDIDIRDGTEYLTFFNTFRLEKKFHDFDYQAQKALNMFGKGLRIK